ncbi:type II toxin-antitoxin system antitoxin SocA domain-containing protein [Corynebacteriaceae bacterium 7-707]
MSDTGLSAKDIAEWFVAWAEESEDADLTPLKLQKLLYYAKGVFMNNSGGVSLFPDRMQAWAHGPVVPEIYGELKHYGKNPIDPDEFVSDDFDWDKFSAVEDSLVETWQKYGVYSAWALRNKTHRESPWLKNFSEEYRNMEITDADLKEFFCQQ